MFIKFSKLAITALISLNCLWLSAQNLHPKSSGEVVHHSYYSLSYLEEAEQAEWVSYTLTPEMCSGAVARKGSFKADPKVSTISAHPNDYKASGYDRGHLAPAASMSHNTTAMSESFYMSNMSPQAPAFNRGGWKRLEELVRKWCVSGGELHVVSGAVLDKSIDKFIGENRVAVPNLYYKVIYSPANGRMIAFVMPNESCSGALTEYSQSVDSVELLTGIDFFHSLDDTIEAQMESHSDISLWAF